MFEGMFSGAKFTEWWESRVVFPGDDVVCTKCNRLNLKSAKIAEGVNGPDKILSERIKKAGCTCTS